ncbi:alpha/beta fold hydrolase [uncultured Pontibacter sp.]|uniref:alpha/beta fold hydrolase n=1 Tax=uncultured Pontibacter sp. TaxID=453356 RepID=UPI00262EDCD0|nr:alpha/beta fold hydrolase [uncultured Pontibacter sp.]
MKFIYFSMLFAMSLLAAAAQELPRRVTLGMQATPLPDSLAQAHRLRHGLLATALKPGATADRMGLQVGDILLDVNKQPVQSPEVLEQLIKPLTPGQALSVTLLRNGKRKVLRGKALAAPLASSPHAKVTYGQVPFREGLLRTVTYVPKAPGRHPAILFIPGFPCRSVDDYGHTPYSQLIEGWNERGYVVMLVEKPGLGDNLNTPDCLQIDLYTEIEAFEQGLLQLKRLSEVDPEQVFLFGHSMGGIIAPVLSQKHAIKGVMVYGSPYRPWFEFAMEMFRFQRPAMGADYVENEQTMRLLHRVLYRYFVLGEHPDTIAAAGPAYKKILHEEFQHKGGDFFWSRDYRYWQQIDELNLTKAWAETEEHVLSIWGEYDFQIVNAADHERIAAIVNHYHPGHATFLALPGTNHSFIQVPGMEEGVMQMQKRDLEYNRTHFNTRLITETDAWMKSVP